MGTGRRKRGGIYKPRTGNRAGIRALESGRREEAGCRRCAAARAEGRDRTGRVRRGASPKYRDSVRSWPPSTRLQPLAPGADAKRQAERENASRSASSSPRNSSFPNCRDHRAACRRRGVRADGGSRAFRRDRHARSGTGRHIRLDKALTQVRDADQRHHAETTAAGKAREDQLAQVGLAYESRSAEPALAEVIGAVAAIDPRRAARHLRSTPSLAETARCLRAMMAKFAAPSWSSWWSCRGHG